MVGVVVFLPKRMDDLEALIACLDQLQYVSKQDFMMVVRKVY